ncbi:MAG: tryptophan synthase subunit alpha [Sphingomonadales bacterium]
MTGGQAPGRLEATFARLREAGTAGLVTFTTAGDPDLETSFEVLQAVVRAGADIVELGMAFSDPMADGPIIEAAGHRALRSGIKVRQILGMVRRFRQKDDATPIVLMGYFNPVYHYGVDAFCKDAAAAGVDGLIVVDLPPEEDAELRLPARQAGLRLIRLATPTTNTKRLPSVLAHASGFLYYVAVAGITGTKSSAAGDVGEAVARIRAGTDLPVAVGFGIKTPEQAAAIARVSDAVVVGSSIVQVVADSLDDRGNPRPDLVRRVEVFVATLAGAVHCARQTEHTA